MNDLEPVSETTGGPYARDGWSLLFAAWLIATIASLGSLFLDRVLGMEPCSLCWFQRVFMYPLAIVLLVGLLPLDQRVVRYALPLAALGWITAFYHLLMYAGVIPEALQPCGAGPSCTKDDLGLFGFVSIPMLSLLAFTLIMGLLLFFWKRTSK
jgi:disulfide bond formation protein DsbB